MVLGRRCSFPSLLSVRTFVTKGGLVLYIYVCVCVCVCARARARMCGWERERDNRVLDCRRSSSVVSREILWSDLHNILTKNTGGFVHYIVWSKTHVEKTRAHAHTLTHSHVDAAYLCIRKGHLSIITANAFTQNSVTHMAHLINFVRSLSKGQIKMNANCEVLVFFSLIVPS